MSLESIFRLSVVMQLTDRLTGPMAKVSSSVDGTASKLDKLAQGFGGLLQGGLGAAAIGGEITSAVLKPVEATFATQRAIGELSSLGIKDLAAVEDAATQFSSTWAGTVKSDFIGAAYDIKSGISSLTDAGVAEYTSLAGLTAKATKSTIGEMTSLFATGYGIYKGYYDDLSDLEFGEMFSAGLATAVKAYKTTGSGMAQAIQTLGASATTAQVPLEEQLSILGMLQATMSGSEAGTKYRAFLRTAAKGGEELGLKFMDANNQLLPMADILTLLRGKFGETMDAAEKLELQKAFGDTESVALIDLLYSKTGDLTSGIATMAGALGQGAGVATQMADAINQTVPAQYDVTTQQIHNLTETLGGSLLPTISEVLGIVQTGAAGFAEWAESHQGLVKAIMLTVLVFGGLLTVVGGGAAVVGGFGLVFTQAGKAISGFVRFLSFAKYAISAASTVLPGLISSVWSFTAALLANPVTWVVIGIVALIAALVLLWQNWDAVTGWMGNAWQAVCNGFSAGLQWVQDGIGAVIGWISDKIQWFKDCGKKIVDTLVDGILSVARKPIDAVVEIFNKIRRFLPFSDAKEGPLSKLTLSGSRVLTTFADGIETNADAPARVVMRSLDRANEQLTLSRKPVKPVAPRKTDKDAPDDEGSGKGNRDKGVTINRLQLNVDLKSIKELPDLLKLLEDVKDLANSYEDAGDELDSEIDKTEAAR